MTHDSDCIFCRIANGQSSARIVYETERFVCFFPISPDVYGHTLIVSRDHYSDLRNCPTELGTDLIATVQMLFERYRERIAATGFNLLNANGKSAEQSIDHLHFHFFPRFPEDGLNAWPVMPKIEPDLDKLFRLLSGDVD
ncbi:HIT family protein [Rhizobium sp. BK491]|uniref:HIT family protein n=1 Tax=Rhizobium sp. BK491 TaxID=2587009 RepID=UPI0013AEE892|nr:HIT family protein [Rhizobium sp. BK491]MBB3571572.1 histidine triad (HIT) family protein [Rhizobium sp. BK491]